MLFKKNQVIDIANLKIKFTQKKSINDFSTTKLNDEQIFLYQTSSDTAKNPLT